MAIDEGNTDEQQINQNLLRLIGGGSAVIGAVAFAAVGAVALDSLLYGIIAGAFTGVGSLLFLPWWFSLQAAQTSENVGFGELLDRVPGSTQRGIFGLGLELGGLMMLTAGFALEETDLVLGTGVAVAVALVVFLAGAALSSSIHR